MKNQMLDDISEGQLEMNYGDLNILQNQPNDRLNLGEVDSYEFGNNSIKDPRYDRSKGEKLNNQYSFSHFQVQYILDSIFCRIQCSC